MASNVVLFPKHKLMRCDPCVAVPGTCYLCDGGLSMCATCGGAEGALTTHCCQSEISHEDLQRIHSGKLDFINTRGWVETSSSFSPPYLRR